MLLFVVAQRKMPKGGVIGSILPVSVAEFRNGRTASGEGIPKHNLFLEQGFEVYEKIKWDLAKFGRAGGPPPNYIFLTPLDTPLPPPLPPDPI